MEEPQRVEGTTQWSTDRNGKTTNMWCAQRQSGWWRRKTEADVLIMRKRKHEKQHKMDHQDGWSANDEVAMKKSPKDEAVEE